MANTNSNNRIRTIVVPASRPDTASVMLDLAFALLDDHEDSRVIVLNVVEEGAEKASEVQEAIQPIVKELQEQGKPVEYQTEIAVSISRGILDATLSARGDAIIMGVHVAENGNVQLGGVVENVMQAAPCNVYIYRFAEEESLHNPEAPLVEQGYRRIIVPSQGIPHADAALKTGEKLAVTYNIPLQKMSVPSLSQPDFHSDNFLAVQLLSFVQILSRKDTLLIAGFGQKEDPDIPEMEDLPDRLLECSRGPVVLICRREWEDTWRGRLDRLIDRLNPTLTKAEQNELMWEARKNASYNIDYIVMILLSAGLASLGLLLNSVAVIIGAMLVAPLMQPLAAGAIGLTTANQWINKRTVITLIVGVLLALLVSFVLGVLLPFGETDEMRARGSPTLLDAAVAFTSGLIAAYATARKGIPAALAGVAIAAALMPPVGTVGLSLALGNLDLALGSSLLFVTNIIFIIVAQNLVFFALGLRREQEEEREQVRNWLWWGVIIGSMVVVIFILFRLTFSSSLQVQVTRVLEDYFEEQGVSAEIRNVIITDSATAEVDDDATSANTIAVIAEVLASEELTENDVLEAQIRVNREIDEQIDLGMVVTRIIKPDINTLALLTILETNYPDIHLVSMSIDQVDEQIAIWMIVEANTPLEARIEEIRQAFEGVLNQEVLLEIVEQTDQQN